MKPMCEPSSARIAQCRSVLALGLDALEEGFLLAAGDAQDLIEAGRDLGVVHPAQGVLQVERRRPSGTSRTRSPFRPTTSIGMLQLRRVRSARPGSS